MISRYSMGTNLGSDSKLRKKQAGKKQKPNWVRSILKNIALSWFRWFHIVGVLALILGCVGTLVFGVYDYYQKNDVLLVKQIEYQGNYHISKSEVNQKLDLAIGSKLWGVPNDTLEQRVGTHPWVKDVRVSRKLPDKLVVSIVEKKPVGLYLEKIGKKIVEKEHKTSHWAGVLKSGTLLPNVQLDKYSLPILDISKEKLSEVGSFLSFVEENYLETYESISQVTALSNSADGEYVIYLRQYDLKLLVDVKENWNVVLSFWESLQQQNGLEIKKAKQVDLRVSGYGFVS